MCMCVGRHMVDIRKWHSSRTILLRIVNSMTTDFVVVIPLTTLEYYIPSSHFLVCPLQRGMGSVILEKAEKEKKREGYEREKMSRGGNAKEEAGRETTVNDGTEREREWERGKEEMNVRGNK